MTSEQVELQTMTGKWRMACITTNFVCPTNTGACTQDCAYLRHQHKKMLPTNLEVLNPAFYGSGLNARGEYGVRLQNYDCREPKANRHRLEGKDKV